MINEQYKYSELTSKIIACALTSPNAWKWISGSYLSTSVGNRNGIGRN